MHIVKLECVIKPLTLLYLLLPFLFTLTVCQ